MSEGRASKNDGGARRPLWQRWRVVISEGRYFARAKILRRLVFGENRLLRRISRLAFFRASLFYIVDFARAYSVSRMAPVTGEMSGGRVSKNGGGVLVLFDSNGAL